MKNIAPGIFRQRLIIEGLYTVDIDALTVRDLLLDLAEHLSLRVYGEPVIHSPVGFGKEENTGYDAFVPLIDSGISAYIWSQARFFSVIVYSCKPFDEAAAVAFIGDLFESEPVYQSF